MKKIIKAALLAILAITTVININAQISGTVFRDYNGNGIKNNSASFNEPFVQGVTVKATLASGVFLLQLPMHPVHTVLL